MLSNRGGGPGGETSAAALSIHPDRGSGYASNSHSPSRSSGLGQKGTKPSSQPLLSHSESGTIDAAAGTAEQDERESDEEASAYSGGDRRRSRLRPSGACHQAGEGSGVGVQSRLRSRRAVPVRGLDPHRRDETV